MEIERRESELAPEPTVLGTNEVFVITADRSELKPLYSQAIGQWTALESELRQRIAEVMNRKNTTSTISDRLGEKGELQVLELFRAVQKDRPAATLLFDHFVAQELGWPIDEVRLVLKRLTEHGWLVPMADGCMLAHR